MRKENVRCPMCGTMNYDVDLDETGGWTKCRLCKAVTCSMDEWKLYQKNESCSGSISIKCLKCGNIATVDLAYRRR